MTKRGKKKRKPWPHRAHEISVDDDKKIQERRTKNREDVQASPSIKGKRKVQEEPQKPTKRMKELQLQQDFRRGFEDLEDKEDANDEEDEDSKDQDIAKDTTPDETPVQRGTARQSKRDLVKKLLTVDEKYYPYVTIKKSFEEEFRLMTRDLDPCYNFKQQTQAMRERFLNRLGADYLCPKSKWMSERIFAGMYNQPLLRHGLELA